MEILPCHIFLLRKSLSGKIPLNFSLNRLKMNISKTIKYLRKQIPSFRCKEGCFDCCGPVPFAKWEWEKVKDKREATSLTCPYASEIGCEIYEQRPIVCRIYGTVNKLRCPYGCGPDKLLSEKKENEIMNKYHRVMEST